MFKLIAQLQQDIFQFLKIPDEIQHAILQQSPREALTALYPISKLKPLIHTELRQRISSLEYPEELLKDHELLETYNALMELDEILPEKKKLEHLVFSKTTIDPPILYRLLVSPPLTFCNDKLKTAIQDHIKRIPIVRIAEEAFKQKAPYSLTLSLKMIDLLVQCGVPSSIIDRLIPTLRSDSENTDLQLQSTCLRLIKHRPDLQDEDVNGFVNQIINKARPEYKQRIIVDIILLHQQYTKNNGPNYNPCRFDL